MIGMKCMCNLETRNFEFSPNTTKEGKISTYNLVRALNFPSSGGISPDNWLSKRVLFLLVIVQLREKTNIITQNSRLEYKTQKHIISMKYMSNLGTTNSEFSQNTTTDRKFQLTNLSVHSNFPNWEEFHPTTVFRKGTWFIGSSYN